jgi:hypothetical protein
VKAPQTQQPADKQQGGISCWGAVFGVQVCRQTTTATASRQAAGGQQMRSMQACEHAQNPSASPAHVNRQACAAVTGPSGRCVTVMKFVQTVVC